MALHGMRGGNAVHAAAVQHQARLRRAAPPLFPTGGRGPRPSKVQSALLELAAEVHQAGAGADLITGVASPHGVVRTEYGRCVPAEGPVGGQRVVGVQLVPCKELR